MLHLDTGNTGFMILCASLVMLMTPGLAFFYGGFGGAQECSRHHDAEFCVDGLDDGDLVPLRLLTLIFQRRLARHHRRQPPVHAA